MTKIFVQFLREIEKFQVAFAVAYFNFAKKKLNWIVSLTEMGLHQ